jgi:2-dehydropantoate 2-reductase
VKVPEKNILVVGPGALGVYFAARLGQRHRRLWLLDRRPDRARRLQEEGLHVTGATMLDWTPPEGHVSSDARGWPPMDLVFILVKAGDAARAAASVARAAARGAAFVFLQNGWGYEKELRAVPPARRVIGVTHEAVTLQSVGRVFHAARGTTVLDGASPSAKPAAALLSAAGFEARVERDILRERWIKLLMNACLNPLGALGDVVNGRVGEGPLAAAADRLLEEISRVSQAAGRKVTPAELRARWREMIERTGANRNSLWQDLHRGRETERRFLLEPLLAEVRRRRVDAPTLVLLDRLLRRVETSATKPA